ncbi:MAG: sodium:solute symporter family protein [Candidatus Aminicenantes bacterium]|nr:sodium:solute symporter family protein [Candidatus Aminicenantes bacterium]
MRPEFFLFLAAYFALVLLAGLAFSRRMKNLEDFFLASRCLSAGLIFLSLTASWFGATSILVSTDEAMRTGLSAFWIMGVPAVLTVLLLAFFLARPLQRLPIMTIPDLVELRYGRLVRHLASGLIIWYMVLLAASQMVALGQFLKMFLGLSYLAGLGLATAVVLLYSMIGGLRSVVFTDVVQFFLLVAGVAGLVIWLGGFWSGTAIADLASRGGKAGYFDLFHNLKENVLIAFSFILAWTISPIALQRIQAARGVREARTGLFAAAGMLFLLYASVTFIGLASLPLSPGQPLSHPLVSEIIASKVGLWFGGLLFVAVLAAILSTMDTAINTGALSLTRDVHLQLFPGSGLGPVAAGRLATLLVGLLAFLVATRFQSILKTIGLSSEIMAEGLFVPGLAMIFSRRRRPLAGLLSLCLGGGYSILSFLGAVNVLPLGLPVWPYSVPYGLALSLAGFGAGLALDRFKRS